jgi:hypothetical protein
MEDGSTKPIQEIAVGDRVLCADGVATVEIGATPTGERDLVTVHFYDGSMVDCTPDHPFLTVDGRMVPAEKLDENFEFVQFRGQETNREMAYHVHPSDPCLVYNIKTDKGTYCLWNGAVVSNCDALRYLVFTEAYNSGVTPSSLRTQVESRDRLIKHEGHFTNQQGFSWSRRT